MPIDREAWKAEIHASMFANAFAQLADVRRCFPSAKRLLIIGPGQGLEKATFAWKGYEIVTLDIDQTFSPDIEASCHDLSMFQDNAFDVVIASHVLEHLPPALLDTALSEFARVAAGLIAYFPVAGRHFGFRLRLGFFGIDWGTQFDLVRFWVRPNQEYPKFCGGQHYWEIGYRGWRLRDVKRRLSAHHKVLRAYRNPDWIESQNFVLTRLAA